jgi:TatD DNase family protein
MEVLERSRAAGIDRWMDPGVDLSSSRRAIDLAEEIHGLFCAVGVHPTESPVDIDIEIKELTALASHSKVRAIGEIGLDNYHKDTLPFDQERRFHAQLDLARELNLPVIVHSRDALETTLEFLETWVGELARSGSPLLDRPGVLHAFEGSLQEAHRAMELGFMLGVGGPITYTNAQSRRDLFATLPLKQLVIETDAPFLSPHPFRGQRNEPAKVLLIAQMLANLQNSTIEIIAEATSNNTARLFAWRDLIE